MVVGVVGESSLVEMVGGMVALVVGRVVVVGVGVRVRLVGRGLLVGAGCLVVVVVVVSWPGEMGWKWLPGGSIHR